MITRFEKYNLNVFFCCCCILSMNESILSTFLATRRIQEVTASYFSNVGKKKKWKRSTQSFQRNRMFGTSAVRAKCLLCCGSI